VFLPSRCLLDRKVVAVEGEHEEVDAAEFLRPHCRNRQAPNLISAKSGEGVRKKADAASGYDAFAGDSPAIIDEGSAPYALAFQLSFGTLQPIPAARFSRTIRWVLS